MLINTCKVNSNGHIDYFYWFVLNDLCLLRWIHIILEIKSISELVRFLLLRKNNFCEKTSHKGVGKEIGT